MSLPAPRSSAAWRVAFRVMYAGLGLIDPLVRALWRRLPMGNVVDLRVAGRRTGRLRPVLLGLLRDADDWYVGHPNGEVAWTMNLASAGEATIAIRPDHAIQVRAVALAPGLRRDRAILATTQHLFPGNLVYRLAWRHIRAVGAFFELEPTNDAPAVGRAGSRPAIS
jgi:hypothetical protein